MTEKAKEDNERILRLEFLIPQMAEDIKAISIDVKKLIADSNGDKMRIHDLELSRETAFIRIDELRKTIEEQQNKIGELDVFKIRWGTVISFVVGAIGMLTGLFSLIIMFKDNLIK